MSNDSLITYILIGDFGLLTMAPMYLLGILCPLVTFFYFCQTVLEESGLIYRLANRCDRPLSRIGLSGRALIPMVTGLACTTVALAALQMLPDKRQRLIASVILAVIVPCSAQVAIFFTLSFLLGAKYIALYIIFIMSTFIVLSLALNQFLPGFSTVFLPGATPAKRFPDLKIIFKRAVQYGLIFLRETAPAFLIGCAVVSTLTYANCLSKLCLWLAPLTEGFLRLPEEAASLFLLSMIKRDLGAAGLLSVVQEGAFTSAQLTVCLIILTLFVPCFASLTLLFKQQKPLTAMTIWLGSFFISIAVGKLASLAIL